MILRLKRMWTALTDVIWPRGMMCLNCDTYTPGDLLCPDCASELAQLRLQDGMGAVRSAYHYAGAVRKRVLGRKLEALGDAAAVLAEAMAEEARAMELPDDVVLTWVTMPTRRRRARGIDHGKVLCSEVAARLGLPAKVLLVRVRKTHTQRGLSARERAQNLQGVFACHEPLKGTVLLIDDVYTTGATAHVCTQALLDAGAARVYVLTAAKVARREEYDELKG